MVKYNYLDLFSGIGGFPIAAYKSGMKFKTHYCSDIEPFSQKLYEKRFPDSIQLGDITKIDTETLRKLPGESGLSSKCNNELSDSRDNMRRTPINAFWERGEPQSSICRVDDGLSDELYGFKIFFNLFFEGEINDKLENFKTKSEIFDIIWETMFLLREQRKLTKTSSKIHEKRYNSIMSKMSHGETYKIRELGAWNKEASDLYYMWEKFYTERFSCSQNLFRELLVSIGKNKRKQKMAFRYEGRLANKPYDKNNRLRGLGNSIVPQIAEILFRRIKEILDSEK
jgi:site-specific DNA-cytosine methylase